jgi:hypothetical protein
MDTRPKISLQSPRPENLNERQSAFLQGVIALLDGHGFQVAPDSRRNADIEERIGKIRGCQGLLVFAAEQWEARRVTRDTKRTAIFPSEFSHIAMVAAVAESRPALVLKEGSVAQRGALREGYVKSVVTLPEGYDIEWLKSREFMLEFDSWAAKVKGHYHVFIGYSTEAQRIGRQLNEFVSGELGLRVYDWHDFAPGDTIWDSIARAERLASCGIFLFMADDFMTAKGAEYRAPRDNIIFEAGFFAGAKGRSRMLIIREGDVKIPSDLDGVIYLSIARKTGILPIRAKLRELIEGMV